MPACCQAGAQQCCAPTGLVFPGSMTSSMQRAISILEMRLSRLASSQRMLLLADGGRRDGNALPKGIEVNLAAIESDIALEDDVEG